MNSKNYITLVETDRKDAVSILKRFKKTHRTEATVLSLLFDDWSASEQVILKICDLYGESFKFENVSLFDLLLLNSLNVYKKVVYDKNGRLPDALRIALVINSLVTDIVTAGNFCVTSENYKEWKFSDDIAFTDWLKKNNIGVSNVYIAELGFECSLNRSRIYEQICPKSLKLAIKRAGYEESLVCGDIIRFTSSSGFDGAGAGELGSETDI